MVNKSVFDPRTKLAVILFASLIMMIPIRWEEECLFVTFLFLLFVWSGFWKKGIALYLLFLFLTWTDQQLFAQGEHVWVLLLDFFSVGYRRLLPTIMAAVFAVSGTRNSEWMAALQKIHLPNVLLVPLAVLFRFFPTLIQDFKRIRQAMRLRGIGVTGVSLFVHPVQSLEYLLIPLLMSAEKTTTELSATALVRGLATDTRHTTVYDQKLQWRDRLVLLVLGGFLLGRVWLA